MYHAEDRTNNQKLRAAASRKLELTELLSRFDGLRDGCPIAGDAACAGSTLSAFVSAEAPAVVAVEHRPAHSGGRNPRPASCGMRSTSKSWLLLRPCRRPRRYSVQKCPAVGGSRLRTSCPHPLTLTNSIPPLPMLAPTQQLRIFVFP